MTTIMGRIWPICLVAAGWASAHILVHRCEVWGASACSGSLAQIGHNVYSRLFLVLYYCHCCCQVAHIHDLRVTISIKYVKVRVIDTGAS